MEADLEEVEPKLKEAVREVVITNLATLVSGLVENNNEASISGVKIIAAVVSKTFETLTDRGLQLKLLESGVMVDATSAR